MKVRILFPNTLYVGNSAGRVGSHAGSPDEESATGRTMPPNKVPPGARCFQIKCHRAHDAPKQSAIGRRMLPNKVPPGIRCPQARCCRVAFPVYAGRATCGSPNKGGS